ncbi:hypothetical protein MLD38_016295 [Melastoma candidum]|uniref:Uncharacterized protein n=1 Tax=Melastoma candidum TaxID=119954 RepID=A0ACB9RKA0_9MYRT|nr:hypothetical protein MLD38_016295 [Melastoma candidum]
MVTYHHLHPHHGKEEDLLDLSSVAPPRISFSSSDFLDDEKDFISINPKKPPTSSSSTTNSNGNNNNGGEFEFFSGNNNAGGHATTMLTADELFYDGKLLPFCQQKQHLPVGETKKNKDVVVKEVEANKEREEEIVVVKAEENSGRRSVDCNNKNNGNIGHCPSWYFDEDPSPRPPKCTVLWKELLRLKKHRGSSSSLSPSSSSSSTSSSSSSMADVVNADDKKETAGGTHGNLREPYLQRIRKGLERTRSGSIRIRPILSVPVCTQHVRTNSNGGGGGLPPMFPTRKGRSV